MKCVVNSQIGSKKRERENSNIVNVKEAENEDDDEKDDDEAGCTHETTFSATQNNNTTTTTTQHAKSQSVSKVFLCTK